jgi:hypothetical protein
MVLVTVTNMLMFVDGWEILLLQTWGHRGRDRTVVGLTTTCAISAYHH